MASSRDAWGIEVGANAIKAMRLRRGGNGVRVDEVDVLPFQQILTTPDLDVNEAIRVGLDQFLARHSLGNASVAVSVPGHKAFSRFAKLPPVEPKRIPDIVKFEAVQQIPFNIEEVDWDYQLFHYTDSPDVEVGIFAITKDRLNDWLSNFQALRVPVHGVVPAPVAVYNALAYDRDLTGQSDGTILLDVGTAATNLIISEGERIWLRTIPIGGNHFTEALVRNFQLTFSKAEQLKRQAGSSKYARQIFQAMRPVFVDLAQEIQKSLGYYQSMTPEAEVNRVLGMGSTFQMPGLEKFLKQQLQLEVSRLDRLERVALDEQAASAEQVMNFPTAYGLALQGLEQERVTCNLLPQEVIREQIWKAKQPWAVAAAAVVALSAGLAYSKVYLGQRAYDNQEDTRQKIQSIVQRAGKQREELKSFLEGTQPEAKVGKFEEIFAYRGVWPWVLNDVNEALKKVRSQAGEDASLTVERLGATEYLPPGSGGQSGSSSGRNQAEQSGPSRPTFRIELVGRLPKERAAAASFLNDTVVAVLKRLRERTASEGEEASGSRSRPYRLDYDVGTEQFLQRVEVHTPSEEEQGSGAAAARGGRAPRGTRRMPSGPPSGRSPSPREGSRRPSSAPPSGSGEPPSSSEGDAGAEGSAEGEASSDGESKPKKYSRFTIRWRIELLKKEKLPSLRDSGEGAGKGPVASRERDR